ncbi:thiamine-monophosphate kinase [Nitrospira sp.]|nr:thiamine-monophosphate kinase [Nitrospira sp.]
MPGARSRRSSVPLDEFALIDLIRSRFGGLAPEIVAGIGDDAAVVRASGTAPWIFTTDLLADGIHFSLATTSLVDLGYKAGAANLSDLAAMGAHPRYLLVDVAIPSRLSSRDVLRLYRGLSDVCRPHDVRIIGGDTSGSREGLFIAITAIGRAAGARAILRRGAQPGDRVFVSGFLGDALGGLILTQMHPRRVLGRRLPFRHRAYLLRRHRRPECRVALGTELGRLRLATAMIDLSDGLSADLPHLCEASRVGAQVDLAALPVSAALRGLAAATSRPLIDLALQGGEDYELLFATRPHDSEAVRVLARHLHVQVTEIGRIVPWKLGRQVREQSGFLRPLPMTGYRHFRTSHRP